MTASDNVVSVPHHIGVIPDGNRRWASAHHLPSLEGHRRGLTATREVALAAFERGVKVFTMFAFSTENWQRTTEEVGYLMDLFYGFLTREFEELIQRDVRFRFAGEREGLDAKLITAIDELEARTADLKAGTVVFCLNYGGHHEIAAAAAELIRRGVAPEAVTPALLTSMMYAPEVPPVDLVIRTSGEQRLSGFMLWRAAYAELAFVDKHWPDFTAADLDACINDYSQRQRRFGK